MKVNRLIGALLLISVTVCFAETAKYGPVKSGDNLWRIAKEMRADDNISITKMADILYRSNPQAFSKNRKDRLKLGAYLYLPRDSNSYAYEARQQKDNTSSQQESKRLSVDDGKLAKVIRQLLISEEENKELKHKLIEFEAADQLIKDLKQELAYKEDKILALRKRVERLEESTPIGSAEPSYTDEEPVVETISEDDFNIEKSNEFGESRIEASEETIEIGQDEDDAGFSLQSLLIPIGVGVFLLLGVIFFFRRKPEKQPIQSYAETEFDELSDELVDEGEINDFIDSSEAPAASADSLLLEANISIENHQYDNAKALIEQALFLEPNRLDIKLRRIKLFYLMQDEHGFLLAAEEFNIEIADDNNKQWQEVAVMGAELLPDNKLFISTSEIDLLDEINIDDNAHLEDNIVENYSEEINSLTDDEDPFTDDLTDLPPDDMSDLGFDEIEKLFQDDMGTPTPASDIDESFDMGDLDDNNDEVDTKLELAQAFIDMGDGDQAKGIIEEVIIEGNASQIDKAKMLLLQI